MSVAGSALAAQVHDCPERKRYELAFDGAVAFIDYRRSPGVIAMLHAEVPKELEGRGVGSALVRGALELARGAGLTVQPYCSFVSAIMQRHPEYHALRAPL